MAHVKPSVIHLQYLLVIPSLKSQMHSHRMATVLTMSGKWLIVHYLNSNVGFLTDMDIKFSILTIRIKAGMEKMAQNLLIPVYTFML